MGPTLVILKGNDTMTEATPAAAPAAPLSEADDKLWASLAHLGGIIGPLPSLLIFLILKDRGAKVRVEAKEALNWQITFFATYIVLAIINGIVGVAAALSYSFGPADAIGLLLGFLIFAVWAVNIVFSIIGFVKVNGGGSYRYPVAVRLIK